MHSALVITLVNTVFWFALHFGVAELITHLPAETQHRLFDWNRPFFRVSEREMALYRRLRLPRWKDRLPQFNPNLTSAIWPPSPPRPISGSFWKSPVTRRSSTN